jgi:hypothetical protein
MTQRNDVYECLPATPVEIADRLGITLHTAHSVLHALMLAGRVYRTSLRVENRDHHRGPRYSLLWDFCDYDDPPNGDCEDDDESEITVSTADLLRAQRGHLLRHYRRVTAKCEALKYRQRHAFTHMGIE